MYVYNVQVFGKDVRALLAVSCQKLFYEAGHTYYHYGPLEQPTQGYGRQEMDLQLGSSVNEVAASVSRETRGGRHTLVLCDRVFEHGYLQDILRRLFTAAAGRRFKTDDAVLNLSLLSLQATALPSL